MSKSFQLINFMPFTSQSVVKHFVISAIANAGFARRQSELPFY